MAPGQEPISIGLNCTSALPEANSKSIYIRGSAWDVSKVGGILRSLMETISGNANQHSVQINHNATCTSRNEYTKIVQRGIPTMLTMNNAQSPSPTFFRASQPVCGLSK